MVGDDHQPSSRLEREHCALKELFQGAHFLVDLYAQGLEHLRENFVLRKFWQHRRNGGAQFPSAPYGLLLPGPDNQRSHLPGSVHLTIDLQYAGQSGFVQTVYQLGRRDAALLVHPHVQFRVKAEGEAPVRRVELM